MGKCLAFDSEILLADGSVKTIEEIHRAGAAQLLTLGDDFKFHSVAPSYYVDDGHKSVFRVTTRLGRVIETTLAHPFLTVGRRMRITGGPFAGLEGVLKRRKSGLRVVVSLELIQRSVAVDADAADVRAVVG